MSRNKVIALIVGIAALGGAYFFLSGSDKSEPLSEEKKLVEPTRARGPLMPLVPAAAKCTMQGSVVMQGTSTPVADAIVALVHTPSTVTIAGKLIDAAGPITTRTDESGNWKLEQVTAGAYEVTASLPAHIPDSRTKVVCGDSVDLELAPGGALLSGHVTDVGGGAIAGVLMLAGWEDGSGATWTDAEGRYEMHLAPDDRYWVRAISADYVESSQQVRVNGATTANFELVPSGSIRGTVLNRTSREPVADAVILRGGSSRFQEQGAAAQTDADGTFEIKGLSSGAIELRAVTRGVSSREATVVELRIAEQRDGVEILVDEAFSIRGRVVQESDKTIGVAGMNVTATEGGGGMMARFSKSGSSAFAPTAADGSFEIVGLQPNTYELVARGDAALTGTGTSVEISDSDVDDIVISVALGVTVRGRVEPPGVTRINLEKDGEVGLLDLANGNIFNFSGTTSKEDGSFELNHVADGKFLAVAKATSGDQGSSKLAVSGEDVDGLVIALESRGSVSGIVVNTEGEPVAGVAVSTTKDAEDKADDNSWRSMMRSRARGTSGAEGKFRIGGLEDGSYTVFLDDTWVALEPSPEMSASAAIESHSHVTGIRLTLQTPKGRITGIVRSDDGSPLADSWVTLQKRREIPQGLQKRMEESGEEMTPERMKMFYQKVYDRTPALTGSDGRFTLSGLAEGTYGVTADAPDGSGRERVYEVALGDDVELVIRSLGGVSGTVTAEGTPVKVYDVNVEGPTMSDVHVVNEEGHYQVGRLEAGSYTISVRTKNGSAKETVQVEAGSATEMNFKVESWASIRGRVVNAETGEPLTGLVVIVQGDEGAGLFSGTPPQTNEDGIFAIEDLPAGRGALSLMSAGILKNFSPGAMQPLGYKSYVLTPGEELDLGKVQALPQKIVDAANRGTLGLSVRNGPTALASKQPPSESLEEVDDLLWVTAVVPKGPADRAGIEVGDQITKIREFSVGESGGAVGSLMLDSKRLTVKESLALVLLREDKELTVQLVADAVSN